MSKSVKKLAWIKEYKTLILDLHNQCQMMKEIFMILKNKGLSQATKINCVQILNQSNCPTDFKEGIKQYLENNLAVIEQTKPLLCCSDIIESYFGKYKNMLSKNGSVTLTDCLSVHC